MRVATPTGCIFGCRWSSLGSAVSVRSSWLFPFPRFDGMTICAAHYTLAIFDLFQQPRYACPGGCYLDTFLAFVVELQCSGVLLETAINATALHLIVGEPRAHRLLIVHAFSSVGRQHVFGTAPHTALWRNPSSTSSSEPATRLGAVAGFRPAVKRLLAVFALFTGYGVASRHRYAGSPFLYPGKN